MRYAFSWRLPLASGLCVTPPHSLLPSFYLLLSGYASQPWVLLIPQKSISKHFFLDQYSARQYSNHKHIALCSKQKLELCTSHPLSFDYHFALTRYREKYVNNSLITLTNTGRLTFESTSWQYCLRVCPSRFRSTQQIEMWNGLQQSLSLRLAHSDHKHLE